LRRWTIAAREARREATGTRSRERRYRSAEEVHAARRLLLAKLGGMQPATARDVEALIGKQWRRDSAWAINHGLVSVTYGDRIRLRDGGLEKRRKRLFWRTDKPAEEWVPLASYGQMYADMRLKAEGDGRGEGYDSEKAYSKVRSQFEAKGG
jgi:hypothetical protein